MSVFALGLNHTTAPLDVRGRFAFTQEQLGPTLHGLRERLTGHSVQSQPEVALLSTCNRTELYFSEVAAASATDSNLVRPAVDWLASVGGISSHALMDHSYVLEDGSAARHAFRVASGLDSMVLGEPQILGQMKDAVRIAEENGTLGTQLHKLFQRSFSVAKEVRSTTAIGANIVSMAGCRG